MGSFQKIIVRFWFCLLENLKQLLAIQANAFLYSTLAFVFTHVCPRILDIRYTASIYSVSICSIKLRVNFSYWQSSRSIFPVMYLLLSILGLTFLYILLLSWLTCCTNSCLSWWSYMHYKFYSSRSSSTGRTMVKQSRSLKKCLINRLMRFLVST